MKKIILKILFIAGFSLPVLAQQKIGDNPTTKQAGAVLELESMDKALLVTRVANTSAVTAPVNGMIIYDNSSECFKGYQNGSWSGCGLISEGTVTALNCAGASLSSNLTSGIVANGISVSVPYTGGNGGAFTGQIVPSTGVAGLTATTLGGTLANGAGSVVYTISGTPASPGTASFSITIGGQNCSFDIPVAVGGPLVSTLDCPGAAVTGTLTANTTASGAFISVPYTGGNGIAYSGQLVSSSGVTGLIASLNSGTLTSGAGGTLTLSISGTPNTNGVATFALTFGGVSCSVAVNVNAQPAVATLDCAGSTPIGTLSGGVAASGVTQTVPYTGGNGANYSATSFASSGVSGLTANLAANTLANGSGSIVFTITGTPLTSGTATFNITLFGTSCSFTRLVDPAPASIGGLTCASATFTPSLMYNGVGYSGTLTVPYTGGNGGTYSAGAGIASSGVTGLTATLQAGTLASGAGNLTYDVTGTPGSVGTASFALSFGGQSCSATNPVVAPPISAFTCSSATFSPSIFSLNTAYSGTLTIPYTGGNGTSYALYTVTSTGNTSFTATLPAGTLANGAGNLVFNVTGTSASATPAVFTISFGGQTCTKILHNCGAYVAAGVFKGFGCYNLGNYATTEDPNIPVRALNGSYYQWGRTAPAAIVTAAQDQIVGTWGSQGGTSDNGNWTSTGTGGPNDPCPAGFRVPSLSEWQGVLNTSLNTVSYTGSWLNDGNFTTAIHYGPSASVKTLTLPAAGGRNSADGNLFSRGTSGFYWSSTESGTASWYLYFQNNLAYPDNGAFTRLAGYSVRCIAE